MLLLTPLPASPRFEWKGEVSALLQAAEGAAIPQDGRFSLDALITYPFSILFAYARFTSEASSASLTRSSRSTPRRASSTARVAPFRAWPSPTAAQ